MDSYREWIKRARSSLELAKYSDNKAVCYEDLCFQAQQAVEKGLKGLLIFYGVEPERTHNLLVLLQELERSLMGNSEILCKFVPKRKLFYGEKAIEITDWTANLRRTSHGWLCLR